MGEYEVTGKLGEGGFGSVFAAVQPLIGKNVAIKVLKRQFSSDPQMASRFISEARAVNQIGHRYIIDVFSFGQLDDGRLYYVMSLLDGKPLDEVMRERGGALSLGEAVPILSMIAEAVDAAHKAGVAHRDLKPENVFICADGTVKLLDFGIAKLSNDDVKHKTQTGAAMGTAVYMSPEQARGRNVDHRTDIYAFGAMTFQMLTGELPFWGTDFMDILMKQIATPPPKPSETSASISAALDAPLLAMLEKNPERRPETMTAAVNGIRYALGEDVPPPKAPPPEPAMAATMPGRRAVATAETAAAKPAALAQTAAANPTASEAAGAVVPVESIPPVNAAQRSPVALVAIGAGVVAVAAVAFVALRGGNDTAGKAAAARSQAPLDAAIAAAAPVPDASSVAPSPDAAPVVVTIEFDDSPKGTKVLAADGTVLGTAPGSIELRESAAPVALILRRDGYEDLPVPVTPDRSKTVSAKLTRISKATRRAKPKATKPKTNPLLDPNDIPSMD